MTAFINLPRWLPLIILVSLALAFEPVRSGFVFANQSCEFFTDRETALGAVFNFRHLVSFGLLCFVAALSLRKNRIVKAAIGTFLFSVFLEFLQSFFATGHCRLWDLFPNVLGIGLAVVVFWIGTLFLRRMRQFC